MTGNEELQLLRVEIDGEIDHHAYATHFDWEQMTRLRAKVNTVIEQVMADAQAFQAFLDDASGRDED